MLPYGFLSNVTPETFNRDLSVYSFKVKAKKEFCMKGNQTPLYLELGGY